MSNTLSENDIHLNIERLITTDELPEISISTHTCSYVVLRVTGFSFRAEEFV
jgi:hypothetical protein